MSVFIIYRTPEADIQTRIRELVDSGATNKEIQEFISEQKDEEVRLYIYIYPLYTNGSVLLV